MFTYLLCKRLEKKFNIDILVKHSFNLNCNQVKKNVNEDRRRKNWNCQYTIHRIIINNIFQTNKCWIYITLWAFTFPEQIYAILHDEFYWYMKYVCRFNYAFTYIFVNEIISLLMQCISLRGNLCCHQQLHWFYVFHFEVSIFTIVSK